MHCLQSGEAIGEATSPNFLFKGLSQFDGTTTNAPTFFIYYSYSSLLDGSFSLSIVGLFVIPSHFLCNLGPLHLSYSAARAACDNSTAMSSSDYNYDDQGQFFPFFLLTMVGLVTVPLTYNVLKASTDLEQTAARIKSDFKPQNVDIIDAQRRRRKRQNRKTKRIVAVFLGYAFMAYMTYLIVVTQRTVPKLWDPYDILGVSRVSLPTSRHALSN